MNKKYNLMIVTIGMPKYEDTIVQRINVITGDYLPPAHLDMNLSFPEQVRELVELIKRDKPEKIIFDKVGMGYMFYDSFMYLVKYDDYLYVDSFGTIGFKEDI